MITPTDLPVLNQVLTGATAGDAITTHAFDMQRWLHGWGIRSEMYALHIHDSVADRVRPLATYRPGSREKWVLYHHSIGSDVPDYLLARSPRLLLVHHNVTPPEFFAAVNPGWTQMAAEGETQLLTLRDKTDLALADSGTNEQQLLAAGYTRTGVVPIALPEAAYDHASNDAIVAEFEGKRPLLLFVGRLSPNKKQEDLVKLLYYLRQSQPNAHLVLVGDPWIIGYDTFVQQLAADLGLADAITLTGKISQADMVTFYRTADFYVSMSEHEGFGKPLIESMHLGLPVLAYGAAGVLDTMGPTGIRFHAKKYAHLAELITLLLDDDGLRQRLVARQRQHVAQFYEPQVQATFAHYLEKLVHG